MDFHNPGAARRTHSTGTGHRRPPLVLLLITVLVVLAATACGTGTIAARDGERDTSEGSTSSRTQPEASDDVGTDAAVADLADDIRIAEEITNGFWRENWSRYFSGSYGPPTVVGAYDGSDAADAPTCNGTPLEADNAYYCPSGDFVAWDIGLLRKGFQIGDAWVYMVIAHEWGHAIQARLSEELQGQDTELQADCLAGATIYGAARDGRLAFDEGDEKELVNALTAVADETPWTNSSDHGDAFERVGAFNTGRRGGVNACLAQ